MWFSPLLTAFLGTMSMAFLLSAAQVSALVPVYMVSGSYGSPTLRAGGLRVDSPVLWPVTRRRMTDVKLSAASSALLPPFPGERPPVNAIITWLQSARPLLTASQASLVAGYMPRDLLAYTTATLPALLVLEEAGATASMVATRDTQRLVIGDANAVKELQKAAHLSEIENGLFKVLQACMLLTAPLLLDRFERMHKQDAPFAEYGKGSAACGPRSSLWARSQP